MQEADGTAELRAGEGEEAELEGAAGGQEVPQQAAEGAVASRQRAGTGDRRVVGALRLSQQCLGAAGFGGEEEHLAHRPPPPGHQHLQGQAQRRQGRQHQAWPPCPRRPHRSLGACSALGAVWALLDAPRSSPKQPGVLVWCP